jgi:hypothetical protein
MVEHGFRKAGVMGSSPVIGCIDFETMLLRGKTSEARIYIAKFTGEKRIEGILQRATGR